MFLLFFLEVFKRLDRVNPSNNITNQDALITGVNLGDTLSYDVLMVDNLLSWSYSLLMDVIGSGGMESNHHYAG